MAQRLNALRRTLLVPAPVEAVVMAKDPHRRDKFEPAYVGPYTVVRRTTYGTYVLKEQTGDMLDRHVPADQLKLISKTARQADTDDDGNVYVVQQVLSHRVNAAGMLEFFVHWKGYPARDSTWVIDADFQDDRCIRDYWEAQDARKKLAAAQPADGAAAATAEPAQAVPHGKRKRARG
jgi:hypothetical protein